MKKLISFGAAAALAIALSASTITPSSADPGAAFAGGVLGFMAGAAVAGGMGPNYYYRDSDYGRWRGYGGQWGYRDYSWRSHVRACFQAYGGAYDPRQDAYFGRDRRWHRCRL
ncbi:MAG: hypothetical protein ABI377_11025 [Devosia sp.]